MFKRLKKSLSFSLLFLLIFSFFSITFTACGGGGGGGGGSATPLTDAEAVAEDAAFLDAEDIIFTGSDTPSDVTGDFTLPTSGLNGTTIAWEEKTDQGNNIILSGEGNSEAAVTCRFDPYTVILTATISKGTETATKDISIIVVPRATTKAAAAVDSVTFKMVLVPGGFTFPTGTSDDAIATVDNAYWIGETQVTYELWKKVYDWATDDDRGANKYRFANVGLMGSVSGGAGMTNQHPVTVVNWRDSMVWCNAMTEWYNAHKETSYDCVYTYSGAVIRDSGDSNATVCDGAVPGPTAKGFRLLTSNEWELAARYRGGNTINVVTKTINNVNFEEMEIKWTKGNSASGAIADYNDSAATGKVAVYSSNSGSKTAEVRSKGVSGANALGLYDMSGNVWEWNFDPSESDRVLRGGSWLGNANNMRVGHWGHNFPYFENHNVGFRFARSK